ncbi:MAG: Asp-tRNA(Asn)/Glu-tRNA(Gln) amidotransferase subunit GatB [Candidatus Paceibacterota bacterium]
MSNYTPTIGLEIHVELKTKSKMFCGCPNNPHDAKPNANICPVCLAHPGTLPTVNKEAVKNILLVGNALQGEISSYSEFDRKNYFYPDIPKGYQISQYEFPFVKRGMLNGVAITRVHLEEDTARSLHDQGEESIVDFNRAGVPLMELVTEPVIHDAETAGNFARELQLLLRTLGVSDANMERGEMRVEANISVSDSIDAIKLGTKVEVKNLNSFKSVQGAIEYEIERQINELENGNSVIPETRGWDEQKGITFSQRMKEEANDYRYFPDPDIPKFDIAKIDEFNSSRLTEMMPELPSKTRIFLSEIGVSQDRIELLLAEPEMLAFFREVASQLQNDAFKVKTAVNYLTSDILGIIQSDKTFKLSINTVASFVELIEMVSAREISSRVAKDLLYEVVFKGIEPRKIANERDLLQKSTSEQLLPIVREIISENSSVVADYKDGKEASLQFLIGQAMKATKGSANPELLQRMFKERLS